MTATSAPTRPDPTRTGTVWVTGTGAFLLLAAAAVFIAVRWSEIDPSVKLGALGLITGGCLLAGRRLKDQLPATAGALFHLGAFLVPIVVAAVGVRARLEWPELLLLEGAVATATFAWAAHVERSVVLRWSAVAASVALAGGIGTQVPLPPAVLLVALAAGALHLGQHRLAIAWAAVAALVPVAALDGAIGGIGAGTVADLRLVAGHPPVAAVLAALGAGAVLALVGRRLEQAELALVGIATGLAGAAVAWLGSSMEGSSGLLALAAAFLGIELAAFAVRDDAFWRSPAATTAQVAELGALVGVLPLAIGAVRLVVGDAAADPLHAAVAVLVGAGLLVADRRGVRTEVPVLPVAIATAIATAIAFGTGSGELTGIVLAGAAVVALASKRLDAVPMVIGGALLAPVLAIEGSVTSAVLGLVGSCTLAELAVRTSRRPGEEDTGWLLSLLALVPAAIGAADLAAGPIDGDGAAVGLLVAGVVGATALAAWLDRGTSTTGLPFGSLARVGGAAVLAGGAGRSPREVAIVAAAVVGCSLFDAVRLGHPGTALGASIAAPIAVGAFVHGTGLDRPATGVALAVAAVVFAGLGSLAGRRWLVPAGAAAGLALTGGLALASVDPVAFAHSVVLGAAVIGSAAVVLRRTELSLLAGVVATMGLWLELGAHHVTTSEPYVAPVAAFLAIAGWRAHRTGATSSWIAFGPAVALLGGTALQERMAGGAGWHAVVAGAVGVAAVVAGGQRKLAGPLVIGTGLLVALVGYESLAITAGVPTWAWLATGGTLLLGAGVAMERRQLGPLETGRRLVDVVNERFT